MGGNAKEGGGEGSARAPPTVCVKHARVRCEGDGFWLAPGRIKLKRTTSGPNPGPEPWVWARCGNCWFGRGLHQK